MSACSASPAGHCRPETATRTTHMLAHRRLPLWPLPRLSRAMARPTTTPARVVLRMVLPVRVTARQAEATVVTKVSNNILVLHGFIAESTYRHAFVHVL